MATVLLEANENFTLASGTSDTSVFASNGNETLAVGSGSSVKLSGFQNDSGDTVQIGDSASTYTITRSGVEVTLSNGTNSITVPAGKETDLQFADTTINLAVNSELQEVTLGDQVIANSAAPANVTALGDGNGHGGAPISGSENQTSQDFEATADVELIDDPVFSGFEQAIKGAVANGLQQWDEILDLSRDVTLDIRVSATDTSALAIGGSAFHSDDVRADGGVPSVFANKILTGEDSNQDQPDASIALSRSNFDQFYFETPETNGLSADNIMAHELGHALAFSSFSDRNDVDMETIWDVHLRQGISGPEFTGSNAVATNQGEPIPLDDSAAHFSESAFDKALMTPKAEAGGDERMTGLEVAVLDDLGFPVSDAGIVA